MPQSPQDADHGASLSLEEAAERYNFPLSQLQRRVLTGRIPGAFQVTLPDGSHPWRIPVASMTALGYRQVQGPPEVSPQSLGQTQLSWGGTNGAPAFAPEPPSPDESQLMSRLAEIEARFARLKEQEQRAIEQVAARRADLDARERAVARRERLAQWPAGGAGESATAPADATVEEVAKLAAARRQLRFEQAELAATRATVHDELAEIRAAEDRIRLAKEDLERRERALAARERRLQEVAERDLARTSRD